MVEIVTWIIRIVVWGFILGASGAAVVRMFRHGRIESHSMLSGFPPWLRDWMLGESGKSGKKS
jgi:hypothetical protein